MPAEELPPNSHSRPIASPPAGDVEPTRPQTAGAGAGRRLPLWTLTVAGGLVAGVISWAGAEATCDRFKLEDAIVYPPDYNQISGYHKMAVQAELEGKARVVVARKQTAVA